MAQDLNTPPNLPYLGTKKPVMTARGWEHPDTGELLKCVQNGAVKAGAADVVAVIFPTSFVRGANFDVIVKYNEKVNVSAGSTLVITALGGSDVTLKAAAQNGVQDVLYNKQNGDGTTQETIPDRADTYSVGTQTIGGTIVDTSNPVKASKVLTVTANPVADETVVIGSDTYTFKATVSTTAKQVKIGATKEISIDNLAAAINADSSAGTGVYGSSTVANTNVTAVAADATLTVTAITAGTAGNSISISETLTNGTWAGGATNLSGGAAGTTSNKTISSAVSTAVGTAVVAPGTITSIAWVDNTLAQGDALGVTVHYDQKVDVTAGATLVVTSTTGNVTLYAATQTNVNDVVFDKKSNNSTPETVPASAKATGTLTNDGVNVSNGDTVTIDGKVYTFESSLTNVDGHVKIGASNTASMTNLFHAINASGGVVGTDYATATTAHPTVDATNPTGTTVALSAKTAGTAGNSIATTETSSHLSWGSSTLTGGTTKAPTSLSVAAQTITGTIVDHGTTSVAASKVISSTLATGLAPVAVA